MARSAKRRRKPALLRDGAVALGGAISRNPVLVGGSTAFLVALAFVSANALWYQPHFHSDAFFATRNLDGAYVAPDISPQTTIHFQRESEHISQPKPDPVVERVQGILRDLDFYSGTVDGIAGPNTRNAIETYRKKAGLRVSDRIDEELLTELGVASATVAIDAKPAPVPREPDAGVGPDPLVKKIQAGLKAFGSADVEVDGVIGAKTKSAIREFQSLFGLPVTGEPDEKLYTKMREIGLTN